jgi:hypothetical protein
VLARDRVRAGSLAPADRVDERVVLVLRDEEDLPRLGQRRVHHQEGARRPEREGEDLLESPAELRALREGAECVMELLVEPDVLHERLDALRANDGVQPPTTVRG